MKKFLTLLGALVLAAAPLHAQKISALPTNSSPVDADLTLTVHSGVTSQTTLAQEKAYFQTGPFVLTSGSYSDPTWLTALSWSKLLSKPTTLSGYGITDGLTSAAAASTYAPISGSTNYDAAGAAAAAQSTAISAALVQSANSNTVASNVTLSTTALVVSGAGTTAANGVYTQTGTYNGHPFYNKTGDQLFVSSIVYWNSFWQIFTAAGTPYSWYVGPAGAVTGTWSDNTGTYPPPTVAWQPGGTATVQTTFNTVATSLAAQASAIQGAVQQSGLTADLPSNGHGLSGQWAIFNIPLAEAGVSSWTDFIIKAQPGNFNSAAVAPAYEFNTADPGNSLGKNIGPTPSIFVVCSSSVLVDPRHWSFEGDFGESIAQFLGDYTTEGNGQVASAVVYVPPGAISGYDLADPRIVWVFTRMTMYNQEWDGNGGLIWHAIAPQLGKPPITSY